LIYDSTTVLIKSLQAQKFTSDFIVSAVVLGFLILVAFIELIGYKCLENKN